MSKQQREVVADWLIIGGALVLLVSLFFTWSHQFSRAFLAQWGSSAQLRGVPHDPSAWQVYSAADVVLAVFAGCLVLIALLGSRGFRFGALLSALLAVWFVTHALGHPPTNGANIFDPAQTVPGYARNAPASGPGELVALLGLIGAMAGLALSFTAD